MAQNVMSIAAAQLDATMTIDNLRGAMAIAYQPSVKDFAAESVEVAGLPAEWVIANGVPNDAWVALYIHGGAYLSGAPEHFRNATVGLSRIARARVLVPDYRLAPEHPFPAQLDDAITAYRWLVTDGGVDARRVAIVGDSAGGALAVSLAADVIAEGLPAPACVVANSPYADMAAASPSLDDPRCNQTFLNRGMIEWLIDSYLRGNDLDPRNPRLSPVYRDLTGLPPLLVQVAGLDNLHDDGLRLAAQARAYGVDTTYSDYVFSEHIWIVNHAAEDNRWARVALEEMRDFIGTHIAETVIA